MIQFNAVLEKTYETPRELQYAYSYKSAISFILNKEEEFPPLSSLYRLLVLFTDSAKLSARVRKNSEKTVFPISEPNIHNSVSGRKSQVEY